MSEPPDTPDRLAVVVDLRKTVEIEGSEKKHTQNPIGCSHYKKVLHLETRELVCAICDARIDPFDGLVDLALRNPMEKRQRKARQEEEGKIEERIEALKKDERNAKARLRRANQKSEVDTERRRLLEALERVAKQVAHADTGAQGSLIPSDPKVAILWTIDQLVSFIAGTEVDPVRLRIRKLRRGIRARRRHRR